MTMRIFGLLLVVGGTGCADKFSNADIAGYVGTWSYNISSVSTACSNGTQQASSGSGQFVIAISTDDPTDLQVAATSGCSASPVLAPGPDGYDLVSSTRCLSDSIPFAAITQYHVTVDSHHPQLMIFSRTTSTTQTSGTMCTTADSGTATKSEPASR